MFKLLWLIYSTNLVNSSILDFLANVSIYVLQLTIASYTLA